MDQNLHNFEPHPYGSNFRNFAPRPTRLDQQDQGHKGQHRDPVMSLGMLQLFVRGGLEVNSFRTKLKYEEAPDPQTTLKMGYCPKIPGFKPLIT